MEAVEISRANQAEPIETSRWDMVSMLPLHYQGRVFINGFPGAGNVLVQRLCEEVLKHANPAIPTSITLKSGALGENYGDASQLLDCLGARYNYYHNLCQQALPQPWPGHAYFQSRSKGHMDFIAFDRPQFIMLTDIDLGLHLNAAIHSSHEKPDLAHYRYYADSGYHVIPLVRHPLDLLVSFAAKGAIDENTDRIFAEYFASLTDPAQKQTALDAHRFTVCRLRMTNPIWLKTVATLIDNYYQPVLQTAHLYPPIKYEDIIHQPTQTLRDLAHRLGASLSDESVASVSSLIGNVELSPQHLNNPSYGKWKVFLLQHLYDLLADTGILDLCTDLGYAPVDKDAFQTGEAVTTPEAYQCLPDELRNPATTISHINSYFGLCSITCPAQLAEAFQLRNIVTSTLGHHLIVSNDVACMEAFRERISHSLLSGLGRLR